MMIKNKKAGEKYLSLWWFLILAIIGIGIVIGVVILNSSDINVKGLEADILATRIVNCLDRGGYIKEEALKEDFDLIKFCRLNKETLENTKHYLLVEIFQLEKCSKTNEKTGEIVCEIPKKYEYGTVSFKVDCKLVGNAYPECVDRYVYVLDKENRKLLLHVKAGSNQEVIKLGVKK